MIHINDSKSLYYNSSDRTFYIKNEKSRVDFPMLEVSNLLDYEGGLLLPQSFNVVKRKKTKKWVVEPDENLSQRCLYFGEFSEDECATIKPDFLSTNCKVIGTFTQSYRYRQTIIFAVILSARTFICFDIEFNNGEVFKTIYTYEPKGGKILFKKIPLNHWKLFLREICLSDYDESLEGTEINFDMLKRYKQSGFTFKKIRNEVN